LARFTASNPARAWIGLGTNYYTYTITGFLRCKSNNVTLAQKYIKKKVKMNTLQSCNIITLVLSAATESKSNRQNPPYMAKSGQRICGATFAKNGQMPNLPDPTSQQLSTL